MIQLLPIKILIFVNTLLIDLPLLYNLQSITKERTSLNSDCEFLSLLKRKRKFRLTNQVVQTSLMYIVLLCCLTCTPKLTIHNLN